MAHNFDLRWKKSTSYRKFCSQEWIRTIVCERLRPHRLTPQPLDYTTACLYRAAHPSIEGSLSIMKKNSATRAGLEPAT